MLKKILLLSAIVFFGFVLASGVKSADVQTSESVKYEKISPKYGYKYSFKRLREKIQLYFLSRTPSRKIDYYSGLLDRRLAELKQVVEEKDIGNIQATSQRYSSTAGELVNYIRSTNLDTFRKPIMSQLTRHLPILNSLQRNFDFNSAEWRFIEFDIDYLKEYIALLNK